MDRFITDVQLRIIRIVNNINPIRFGQTGTVPDDPCIYRILESVRESGIKKLVFLTGKINPVITTGFGNIIILAGSEYDQDYC